MSRRIGSPDQLGLIKYIHAWVGSLSEPLCQPLARTTVSRRTGSPDQLGLIKYKHAWVGSLSEPSEDQLCQPLARTSVSRRTGSPDQLGPKLHARKTIVLGPIQSYFKRNKYL